MSLLNDVLRDLHQREMSQRQPVITPAALRGGNHQHFWVPGKKLMVGGTLFSVTMALLALSWWFGWGNSAHILPADNFPLSGIASSNKGQEQQIAQKQTTPKESAQKQSAGENSKTSQYALSKRVVDSSSPDKSARYDLSQGKSLLDKIPTDKNNRTSDLTDKVKLNKLAAEKKERVEKDLSLYSARASINRDRSSREPAQSSEEEFSGEIPAQTSPATLAKVNNGRDKKVPLEELPHNELGKQDKSLVEKRVSAVKAANSGNTAITNPLTVTSADASGRQFLSRQTNIRLSTNPEAVVNRQLIKAQQIYQRGRPREAEEILRQSLALKSDAAQVRYQLGSWMLARSAYQEVLNLLAGVDVISSPSLRGLKAHASHALGRSAQALALLQTNVPPVNGNLPYHTLRAGLLQQNGRYQEALSIYAELVEDDPGKGEFWAGLAISLDQTGHSSPALRAYRRALSDPRLNPRLVQYAEQRLLNINQRGEL